MRLVRITLTESPVIAICVALISADFFFAALVNTLAQNVEAGICQYIFHGGPLSVLLTLHGASRRTYHNVTKILVQKREEVLFNSSGSGILLS